MGMFDNLFKNSKPAITADYFPESIQEAYITMMYAVAYADGELQDEESTTILWFINRMPIFKFDDIDISSLVSTAVENIKKYDTNLLLRACSNRIGNDYKPTAFAYLTEMVLSDEGVSEEEKKVLEELAGMLNISEELATKIIEVTTIRMKR